MKKLLKNSMYTLLFALAFLVCGVATVSAAAKPSINNTRVTIPGDGVTFMAMEEAYYVINDTAETANIRLNAKNRATGVAPNQIVYNAEVSIVRCKVMSAETCTTWSVYGDGDNGSTVMDKLYAGMTLNLMELDFKDEKGKNTVLDRALGELKSVYGVDKTFFIVVKYSQANRFNAGWVFNGFTRDSYESEVYKAVLASECEDIKMLKPITGSNSVTVSYQSGTPISSVRYFKTTQELTNTFDFETEFVANAGEVVLERAKSNNTAVDGLFTFEFSVGLENGVYYIEAYDLEGNSVVDSIVINGGVVEDENVSTNPNNPGSGNGNNDNINERNIGKIIFISLVVVLVVSVVLVIAQKIADNKKKIY